ncbi:MAG: hypothetical protein HY801_03650 [Candidatus Lindowbacteria bacterium]|nr:hypothetical protein [Candidatus Lindowbacteria bacterium]
MLDRDSHQFREIFDETEILRKPTTGFVAGYHTLPYILLGRSTKTTDNVVEIRGKISVSPKFVISPEHLGPTYGELFGTDGIDESIVGRIFAFPYLKKHQASIESLSRLPREIHSQNPRQRIRFVRVFRVSKVSKVS